MTSGCWSQGNNERFHTSYSMNKLTFCPQSSNSIPQPTPSTMTALHQFGEEMLKLSRGLESVNNNSSSCTTQSSAGASLLPSTMQSSAENESNSRNASVGKTHSLRYVLGQLFVLASAATSKGKKKERECRKLLLFNNRVEDCLN